MVSLQLVLHRGEIAGAFTARLPDDDPRIAVWMPADGESVTVTAFMNSPAEARALRARWRGELRDIGCAPPAMALRPLEDTDWSTHWRMHFRREHVGRRLVILPEWESYDAGEKEWVIRIDPGMSFGTGQHATTRACLLFLERCRDELGEGLRLLDIGCGSGILSVAAALMGFGEITAIDNDPVAVADTLRNAERNGVAGRIRCRQADLADALPGQGYDVTAANLLAGVLTEFSGRIASTLARAPRGMLLAAGILSEQCAEVLAAYRESGFTELASLEEDGWRSLWLGRTQRGVDHP